MNSIKEILSKVNVKDLIKVFNIQFAMVIALTFFVFRKIFSQIIIGITLKIFKSKKKVKETKQYSILNGFFIFLGLYLAFCFLKPSVKPSPKTLGVINDCFKIVCTFYGTAMINSFITKDSILFKKYINKSKNDAVNNFTCKIVNGIVWIISFYIVLKEMGIDLTGLIAGFGIRKCYYFTSSTGYSKKFIKWFCNFNR